MVEEQQEIKKVEDQIDQDIDPVALNPFLLVVSNTDRLFYFNTKKKLIKDRKGDYRIDGGKPVVHIKVDAIVEGDEQRVTSTLINLDTFIYIADDAKHCLNLMIESLEKKQLPDTKTYLDHVRRVGNRLQKPWFSQIRSEFLQHEFERYQTYQDLQKRVDEVLFEKADKYFKEMELKISQSGKGAKHQKKLPHANQGGIVSPSTIIRGTLSWYTLRSKPETTYKYVRWPIEFDMADFIFQHSFLDFNGEMMQLQSLGGRIYQHALKPFNRYCKAPGYERECLSDKDPQGQTYFDYVYAKQKNKDKVTAAKHQLFMAARTGTLNYKFADVQNYNKPILKSLMKVDHTVSSGVGVHEQVDQDDIQSGNYMFKEVISFERYDIFQHLKMYTDEQLKIQLRGKTKEDAIKNKRKEMPFNTYFASITGLQDGCHSVTVSNAVLSFALVSNWTMGNTVYQEKQFTLQIMALMKAGSPTVLLNNLQKDFLTLEDSPYLVFDNDFNYYKFKLIKKYSESELVARKFDVKTAQAIKNAEKKHILNEIHDRYLNHNDMGPWVVEIQLYKGDQSGSKTSQFAVIKVEELPKGEQAYRTFVNHKKENLGYRLVLLNIRGVKEIHNDFLTKNNKHIFGVFDGLFHYLSNHNPPQPLVRVGNKYKLADNSRGIGKYTYYQSCKLYTLEEFNDSTYQASITKTAIKNMFYLFNRYQHYSPDIFYSCLWHSMFGIPTVDKGTDDQKGLMNKMFANFAVALDKRRLLSSMENALKTREFKLYQKKDDLLKPQTYKQLAIIGLLKDVGLLSCSNGINFTDSFIVKLHTLLQYLKLRSRNLLRTLTELSKATVDKTQVDEEFKERVKDYDPVILKQAIVDESLLYDGLLQIVQTIVIRIEKLKSEGDTLEQLSNLVLDSIQKRNVELNEFQSGITGEQRNEYLATLFARKNDPDVLSIQFNLPKSKQPPVFFNFYIGAIFSIDTLLKVINQVVVKLKSDRTVRYSTIERNLMTSWNKSVLSVMSKRIPEQQLLTHYLYDENGLPVLQEEQAVTEEMTPEEAMQKWFVNGQRYLAEAVVVANDSLRQIPLEELNELFQENMRQVRLKSDKGSDSDDRASEYTAVQENDFSFEEQAASINQQPYIANIDDSQDTFRNPSNSEASSQRNSIISPFTQEAFIPSLPHDEYDEYHQMIINQQIASANGQAIIDTVVNPPAKTTVAEMMQTEDQQKFQQFMKDCLDQEKGKLLNMLELMFEKKKQSESEPKISNSEANFDAEVVDEQQLPKSKTVNFDDKPEVNMFESDTVLEFADNLQEPTIPQTLSQQDKNLLRHQISKQSGSQPTQKEPKKPAVRPIAPPVSPRTPPMIPIEMERKGKKDDKSRSRSRSKSKSPSSGQSSKVGSKRTSSKAGLVSDDGEEDEDVPERKIRGKRRGKAVQQPPVKKRNVKKPKEPEPSEKKTKKQSKKKGNGSKDSDSDHSEEESKKKGDDDEEDYDEEYDDESEEDYTTEQNA